MICILVQVLRANVVMLATDHPAQACKVGLNHIRMLAVASAYRETFSEILLDVENNSATTRQALQAYEYG